MPLPPATPVRVQPFFGYRSSQRLVITARALRTGKARFAGAGRWQTLRTMLAQFASREVAQLDVTLEVRGGGQTLVERTQTSDGEGYVRFAIDLAPQWDLPEHPVWEMVTLRWVNSQGPQSVEGYVLAPGKDSNLAVISDIDDTVIETGITGGFRQLARNWKRVLAQLPEERSTVPGADIFYSALGGGQVLPPGELRPGTRIPATHRPFFYVSSSPWNLFFYLVAFMRTKNLPLGPILLRDWGLNRQTFGKASHGLHKTGAVNQILATFPDLRFALIGDDTQGDLPAFADVARAQPDRIAAIFLRIASEQTLSPEEEAARHAIEEAGVPLWLGESFAVGEDFLHELGFTPGGETEQIVRTVEKVETSPAVEDAGQ